MVHQRAGAHDENSTPPQDIEKIDVTTFSFAQSQNNAEVVTDDRMFSCSMLRASQDVFDGTVSPACFFDVHRFGTVNEEACTNSDSM